MGWLRTIAGARWFPYVLIGAASIALTVFGWGYMKGYDKAEDLYLTQMNKALAAQLQRMTSIYKKDMATAASKRERVNNVQWRIKDVYRPNCELSLECVRAFNDGVRATGTNPAGADGSTGAP